MSVDWMECWSRQRREYCEYRKLSGNDLRIAGEFFNVQGYSDGDYLVRYNDQTSKFFTAEKFAQLHLRNDSDTPKDILQHAEVRKVF